MIGINWQIAWCYRWPMTGWEAIFKAGRHTDSAGIEREFSNADLDFIAANYNPSAHEAPLVIGHPKDNSPAFGWVKKLKRRGETLFAQFKQVPEELKEAVRAGHYKKVSVALYPNMTLRHVGLLGGMPPAVKGLGSVAFGANEDFFSIEFNETQEQTEEDMGELERALADKAQAEAEAKAARDKLAQAEARAAESDQKAATAEQAAKEATEKAEAAEARFSEHQAQEMAKTRECQFNELLKSGKAMPGDKDAVLAVATALSGASEITFSEGGEETKTPAEKLFWKILTGRKGDTTLLGEFAEGPAQEDGDGVDAVKAAQKF